jgi:hypothetical protein
MQGLPDCTLGCLLDTSRAAGKANGKDETEVERPPASIDY